MDYSEASTLFDHKVVFIEEVLCDGLVIWVDGIRYILDVQWI